MRIEKGYDPIVAGWQQFQDFKESVMQIYFAKKVCTEHHFTFPMLDCCLTYINRMLNTHSYFD